MGRRRGFVMMWALFTMAMTAVLGGAFFFCLMTLVRRQHDTEIVNEETLIAQDAMEREKYNARFGTSLPGISGDVEQNGRHYEVRWERGARDIEGVPMRELTCHVSYGAGHAFSVSTLVEQREEL